MGWFDAYRFFDLGAVLPAGEVEVRVGDRSLQHFLRRVNDDPGHFVGENKFG